MGDASIDHEETGFALLLSRSVQRDLDCCEGMPNINLNDRRSSGRVLTKGIRNVNLEVNGSACGICLRSAAGYNPNHFSSRREHADSYGCPEASYSKVLFRRVYGNAH